jgi:ribose 5-phosphate isomerase B
MKKLKVAIASDHAAIDLKTRIKPLTSALLGGTIEWTDLGPDTADRVDYPDFASLVCQKIKNHEVDLGILLCGSGIGMSIAANKIDGIRAALCENPVAARLSREHNNAQVLCLGSRFLAPEYASEIANSFLSTPFSEDVRHQARIQKITDLESK